MAAQSKIFDTPKSIAGTALVGLGSFILFGNLTGAAAQWSRMWGIGTMRVHGILPGAALTVAQALPVGASDHRRFFLEVACRMCALLWPILFIVLGAMWARDRRTDQSNGDCEENTAHVDFASPYSTLK